MTTPADDPTLRSTCRCGHERPSHFKVYDKDLGRYVPAACLASFCDCPKYSPKEIV